MSWQIHQSEVWTRSQIQSQLDWHIVKIQIIANFLLSLNDLVSQISNAREFTIRLIFKIAILLGLRIEKIQLDGHTSTDAISFWQNILSNDGVKN